MATPGDGLGPLSVREKIRVARLRAGFRSHADLASAALEHLPEGFTMNRKLIQQMEAGDLDDRIEGGGLDFQLMAIASACNVEASSFDVSPGVSDPLDTVFKLCREHGWK